MKKRENLINFELFHSLFHQKSIRILLRNGFNVETVAKEKIAAQVLERKRP
jgi:hypothetical protein